MFRFHKLIRNIEGQGLTEYLLLLVLISVISIATVTALGNTIKEKIHLAREKINSVSVNGGS